MPDFVEKIRTPSDLEKFNDKANRNQLPRVLLFSSKPETSPLTKYLSTEFRRRVLLAEVKPNKKNEEIMKKYGITTQPAMIVISPSAEGEAEAEPIFFEGSKFTRNQLHSFLSKHALKDPVLTVKKKEEASAAGSEADQGDKETEKDSSSEESKKKAHSEL